MNGPLIRIMGLWGRQAWWLLGGLVISLAALAAGVGLMTVSGLTIGAAVLAGSLAFPAILRGLGAARVVLRYTERLVTHGAMFRALADVRVWFFGRLARTSAGGLGFRQAGDVLARLVGDVEALDGLYLRILLPVAGAVLLLPVLVLVIGHRAPGLATEVGVLFAAAAFALPWMAARRCSKLGGGGGGATLATMARVCSPCGGRAELARPAPRKAWREGTAAGAKARTGALAAVRGSTASRLRPSGWAEVKAWVDATISAFGALRLT